MKVRFAESMKLFVFFMSLLVGVNLSLVEDCINDVEKHVNEYKNVSVPCGTQLKVLCNRKDILFTLWDSSTRIIHSGLNGTNNADLGNYDLCMQIAPDQVAANISGKFCALSVETLIPKEYLEIFVLDKERKTISKDLHPTVEGKYNVTMLGSICLPDACTPEEFTKIFTPYYWSVHFNLTHAGCETKTSGRDLSTFELVTTICLGIILLITVACTIFHVYLYYTEKGEPHDCVKAFSVIYNGGKLLTINTNNVDQFQCMHGMRFLSMMWIIAGHTYSSYVVLPHINQKTCDEWKGHIYSQYIQAGPFAVDTFFFLSGFLLAFGYLKQAKNLNAITQMKMIPLMYLKRYLRLTPAVAAMYFFSISFFKLLGDGPLWFWAVNGMNKPCTTNWWRFFLYIQNYFPEGMCYTQTWYLSADMQMFVLSPLVLIPSAIYVSKKLNLVLSGVCALTVLCVGITIAVRCIVDNYKLDYDTHSRLSDYLVGVMSGILMYTYRGKHVKFHKFTNIGIWAISSALMIFLTLYLHDVNENPTKVKTALFGAMSKPIWSACISWIIFASYFGYGGIVNKFLSNPVFQVGSRLSYCMYVVHGMVVLYSIASTRTYAYFSDYLVLNLAFSNIITSMIVATIFTLAFEAPMITLNKLLFSWIDSNSKGRKPEQERS